MKNIDFTRELIKGRITEIIFEQMFRESGRFTILRFGYEYTAPQLAQYQHLLNHKAQQVLENFRHTPDFVLISEDKTELYLVEIKYRSTVNKNEILEIARKILEKWDHAWLFIASPTGFFFDPCNTIVNNEGNIGVLFPNQISKEQQEKYLNLLKEFEK